MPGHPEASVPLATSGFSRAPRRRPPLFLALGATEPPPIVFLGDMEYRQVQVLKHDSWAATALYAAGEKRAVCKFNRQQPIWGLPMRWLGRWLAGRERYMLHRLAGIPGIPAALGPVRVAGQTLPHAVAHDFIPGHALRRREWVPDHFFPRLGTLLADVHHRDAACVDLHKRENILVGEDGNPYLIDFQLSVALPERGLRRVFRWWLHCLQRSDDYHLLKHHARHRPDQCPLVAAEIDRRRPWWIRWHRRLTIPFRTVRRRLLVALGIRSGKGLAHSEVSPEVAFRN